MHTTRHEGKSYFYLPKPKKSGRSVDRKHGDIDMTLLRAARDMMSRFAKGKKDLEGTASVNLDGAPFTVSSAVAEEESWGDTYFVLTIKGNVEPRDIIIEGPEGERLESRRYDIVRHDGVGARFLEMVETEDGMRFAVSHATKGWIDLTFSGGRSWVLGKFEFETEAVEVPTPRRFTDGDFSVPYYEIPKP